MPLELSLASPALRRVMAPPEPYLFGPQLLPCTLQSHPPFSHLQQPCACSCSADCMDARPSRSCCKEELAIYGTTLTLSLARHDHADSSKEEEENQRSRLRSQYSNTTCDEQGRVLHESSSRGSEEEAASGGASVRKKLRLSKEESSLLEDRFKEQSTLTPQQKNELAKQLNLRPRQVEVWFQNRRARTKLKQTEFDCERLKKCCASLTEENRHLQIEVARLQSLKREAHSMVPLCSGTSTMNGAMLPSCAQCECLSNRAAAPSSSTTTSNSSLRPTSPALSS